MPNTKFYQHDTRPAPLPTHYRVDRVFSGDRDAAMLVEDLIRVHF